MDNVLDRAWKKSEKPFHEKTLAHENLLPISLLRLILRCIIDYCESRYSNHLLYTFDDWHEHDGYITTGQIITFHALHVALESDQSLYNSRQGDDFVYKAFYPSTCDFLLRYYVLELEIEKDDPEYSPGLWGKFTFTGHTFDMSEIAKKLKDFDESPLVMKNSKQYFDNVYAG